MTGPRIDAPTVDATGAPHIPRILSPDEFAQAKLLPPSELAKAKFPVVPPVFAPKDATKRLDPNAKPDKGTPLTGLAGILTRNVAAPMMDNPLSTAAAVLNPAVGVAMAGSMVHDVTQYAGQKAAELSLPPADRARAEADPERIPGERAATEAIMMAVGPLLHSAFKGPTVADGVVDAGAAGLKEFQGSKAVADILQTPLGARVLGSLADKSGMDEVASPYAASPDLHRAWKEGHASAASDAELATAGGERFSGLPVTAELRARVEQHMTDVKDAWDTMFAPANRSPEAKDAANILRATTGEQAAQYEQAAYKLDDFRRAIDPLPDADKLGFIDAIENGRSQPNAEFQAPADAIRAILDDGRKAVQNLGTGKLDNFIENYFPHIWDDPERAKIAFGGKRPMEGGKSFLKQRTIPTTAEGIAHGLTPISTNPVDLTLLKLREMQRYVMAHQSLHEMKDAGLVKYVPSGEMAPDGYARINDNISRVYGKPTVTVKEAFDAGQRASLEKAIADLGGVTAERKVSLGRQKGLPAGTLGYARGGDELVTKFGTHDGVMMHELGHIIDARYGLQSEMAKAGLQDELGALAHLRVSDEGKVDPKYASYIQKPEERVANALHAFLHAPDQMESIAPKTKAFMQEFLESHPETRSILDIKPTTAVKTASAEFPVGGMVIRGDHWAPEGVARIVNNCLSPGLRGNAIYDAYRGLGNVLNQAQLGLSAFHLMFTSMDASVSRMALGLERLAGGDVKGGLGDVASTPVAPITNMMRGAKIREAYLNPEKASPEAAALANAVKEAGGRVRMDSFYRNSAPEKMADAWRAGGFLGTSKALGYSLPALFEMVNKPLMEHIVPMQKLGVFGDMAQKVLADLPPEATLADRRAALAKAWDSVDNRMGQMVYDNLFWNKTFKDLAMASTRSLGWNLGTIRELGGGIGDIVGEAAKKADGQSAEFTHRAAYVMALPITVGMYGAVYQMLRTGEAPSSLKDYFYPRTGDIDADGNPERVQIASYMKDVASYSQHPWQTVKHKVNPLPNAVIQMLNNEDYYGDEIRNPDDPAVKQALQEATFIAKQFEPLGIRNVLEGQKRGDSKTTMLGAEFGITPAPREMVRSEAQNKMSEYLAQRRQSGATPEDAAARDARAQILSGLRGNSGVDLESVVSRAIEHEQLTPSNIVHLLRLAGSTPAQEKFKRLTLAQAMDVFERSTEDEKKMFVESLASKIERSGKSPALAAIQAP